MSEMMQKMMSETPETSGLEGALIASSFALPFIVVILFLLRNKLPAGARKVAMSIAGLLALLSFAGLILQMVKTPAGANQMLTDFIPKSAGVYASMLLTFPPMIFGLWIAVKVIHKRGFKTLMTAHTHFRGFIFGSYSASISNRRNYAARLLKPRPGEIYPQSMDRLFHYLRNVGLESAIGVHAANNLYASILLGYDNSALPTPTVFKTGLNANTDFIFTLLTLSLVCLILWKFKKPLIVDAPVTTANAFN